MDRLAGGDMHGVYANARLSKAHKCVPAWLSKQLTTCARLRAMKTLCVAGMLGAALVLVAVDARADLEIRKNGSSWVRVDDDGTVRLGGSSVGQVESDGTIRKGGSSVGKIDRDGTLRRGGSSIGKIEADGTLRRDGTSWGSAEHCCGDFGSKRTVAAVLAFFSADFF